MEPANSMPMVRFLSPGRLRGVSCVRCSAVLAIVIFTLLPARWLSATDYRHLGLGELTEQSGLILLVKLTPSGEKLDVHVEEVLNGVSAVKSEMPSPISTTL